MQLTLLRPALAMYLSAGNKQGKHEVKIQKDYTKLKEVTI